MGLMDEIRKLTHPYSDQEEDFDDYDDEDELVDEPAPAPASSGICAPRSAPTPSPWAATCWKRKAAR